MNFPRVNRPTARVFLVAALVPLCLAGAPRSAGAQACPVVDPCHQAPFRNPVTSLCDKGPFTGCTLTAVRDSMLLISDRNTNEGANTSLWIQEQGPRRIVVRFPMGACANDATRTCASSADCVSAAACNAIDGTGVGSATFRMSIKSNDTSWAAGGEPVAIYKLADDFLEGNGKTFSVPVDETTSRGTGNGVTYNCSTDTDISNTATDCSPQWNAGGTAIGAPSASVTFGATTTGNVSWTVTADVASGGSRWLVKKSVETNNGRVEFYSREGATKAADANLAPKLIMTGGSYCSDGNLDPGEDCDDGNRVNGDCCSYDCKFESSATVCRASQGICDTAENCTGTSGSCPADVVASAGISCRASTGECDPAETCTGSSGACPVDSKSPAGTACTTDGNVCTADQCDGSSSACQHPAGNAGTSCRASTGECDPAETCTGSSTTCPSDSKSPAGTACTSDGNACTLDRCDGTGAACQHPAGNAGAVCRAAAGACDVAETCTGASATCPANLFATAGTVCRAAASVCDVAETCGGSSASCPADGFAAAGVECRPAVDECDVAESCNGSSGTCPTDLGEPDADGDGQCDVIDPCTNVGSLQDFALKSKLVLSKIGNDATVGNDKVSLSGTFPLAPSQSFSSLDPRTRGARFVLRDRDGNTLLDAVLPGGAYAGRGTRGWKTNSKNSVWQYLDRTTSRIGGISDVKATDRSRNALGGSIKISTRGSKTTYPVVVGDEPVEAILALGDQTDSTAGRCGETAYVAGSCKFNTPATTLTCKR